MAVSYKKTRALCACFFNIIFSLIVYVIKKSRRVEIVLVISSHCADF